MPMNLTEPELPITDMSDGKDDWGYEPEGLQVPAVRLPDDGRRPGLPCLSRLLSEA